MSIDLIVVWEKQKGKWVCPKSGMPLRPSKRQLRMAVEDYFGGIATSIEDNKKQRRFYVMLPGSPSHPATRLVDDQMREMITASLHNNRWIEIWYGKLAKCTDIMLRHQDEITMSMAKGFAGFCVRFWQGKLEPM
jgi:hypothetical protein